jgi:hypothetical protein
LYVLMASESSGDIVVCSDSVGYLILLLSLLIVEKYFGHFCCFYAV